jgi:uncharacterized protein YndB with AHSA1/START domain
MSKRNVLIILLSIAAVVAGAFMPLPFEDSTSVANTVFIARTPEAVFGYVTTPGTWPKWHPSSLSVSGATDHSLIKGERVSENFRVAGRTGEAIWTVIDSEAPRSWIISGNISGREAGSVRYTLSPEASGTKFTREFVYHSPNMLFVIANRLTVRRQIESESALAVQQLRQLLESTP